MNKLVPALGAIVVVSASAWGAGSYYVGQQVEREVGELADALSALDDVRLERFDYERGLTSGILNYDLTWRLAPAGDPAFAELDEVLPFWSGDGIRVQGSVDVRHGPWVGGDAGLALAAARQTVPMPPEAALLLPDHPADVPLLTLTGVFGFDGTRELRLRMADLTGEMDGPTPEHHGRFVVDGVEAGLRLNRGLDRVEVNAGINELSGVFRDPGESVEFGWYGLFADADLAHARGPIWVGAGRSGLERLVIEVDDERLELAGLMIATESEVVDGMIVSEGTFSHGAARFEGVEVQGGEMTLSLRNLELEAWADLVEQLEDALADAGTPPDEQRLEADIRRLLAAKPSFAVDRLSLSLTGEDDLVGRLSLAIGDDVAWPPEAAGDWLAALSAEAELTVQLAPLQEFARLAMAVNAQESGAATSEAEVEAMATFAYLALLEEAAAMPFVRVSDDAITASVELRDGALWSNGEQVMTAAALAEQAELALADDAPMHDEPMPEFSMNPDADPLYGEVTLAAGFGPEPHRVELVAGGAGDLTGMVGGNCVGHVNPHAPDVVLEYTPEAADAGSLYVYAEADEDTTLAVLGPDGEWHCNDDAPGRGLDPGLVFSDASAGRYAIWVGTYFPGAYPAAVLSFSEQGMIDLGDR